MLKRSFQITAVLLLVAMFTGCPSPFDTVLTRAERELSALNNPEVAEQFQGYTVQLRDLNNQFQQTSITDVKQLSVLWNSLQGIRQNIWCDISHIGDEKLKASVDAIFRKVDEPFNKLVKRIEKILKPLQKALPQGIPVDTADGDRQPVNRNNTSICP